MTVKSRYRVKGVRYGSVPGLKRVYVCQCGYTQRTVETLEKNLSDQQQQYEQKRQAWIRERAELQQQIYYLSLPVNSGETKLKRVRQGLIDLIQQTI
jgi:hypothetical protein